MIENTDKDRVERAMDNMPGLQVFRILIWSVFCTKRYKKFESLILAGMSGTYAYNISRLI